VKGKIFLVTGGLGFIGKHFVARCLKLGHFVTNVDIVNYAADRVAMKEFQGNANYRHIREDVAGLTHLPESDVVINFAAESHVDNSIADNRQFCHSNFMGVQRLLELTRARYPHEAPLFVQVGTDEVYGDIIDGTHKETDPLRPSNPYSASKAGADMLVLGWARTYGVRYMIVRMSNNYGMHQYPEKLIPKSFWRMQRGMPALMQGDGSYRRSWLHVEDTVDAILTMIDKGQVNSTYNVCGPVELPNIEVLQMMAKIMDVPEDKAIKQVANRVGQDLRYSLDDSRIRALGWAPKRTNMMDELRKIAFDIDFSRFL
jgi:dTDP-glucose 4,6-dehydratase